MALGSSDVDAHLESLKPLKFETKSLEVEMVGKVSTDDTTYTQKDFPNFRFFFYQILFSSVETFAIWVSQDVNVECRWY